MATESWAGGTITGGAPNPSGGGRGGWIPVQEVPNAPKTVDMPEYHPGKAPSIRYDYPKGGLDMSKRAAALMPKELPGSFEEAGNIRTAAAGKGQEAYAQSQMQAGKAMGAMGQDIANALGSVGNVLERIGAAARDSRDKVANIQVSNAVETHEKELSRIVQLEPPDKWESLRVEADKALDKTVSGVGVRESTKAIVAATVTGVKDAGKQRMKMEGGLKEIKQNNQLAIDQVNNGREEKNYKKADQGVDALLAQNAISKDQAKEMYAKNQFLQGTDIIAEAKLTPENSHRLRDQAEVVMKGGKSKDFEVLNTNPALAPNIKYEADQEIKKHKKITIDDIEARIESGELNTGEKIDQAAKGKFLTKETIAGLKRKDRVVEFSPKAIADVRHRIDNYDYHTDTDGLEYEAIKEQLRATVPKENRAPYEAVLTEKMKKAIANKPESPLENAGKLVKNQAKDLSEANMLPATAQERAELTSAREKMARLKAGHKIGEPNKPLTKADLEKEDKPGEGGPYRLSAKERAAWEADGQRLFDLQEAADEFIRKNPDAKPSEVHDHVFQNTPAAKNIEKNAGSTSSAPRATAVDVLAREKRLAEARATAPGLGAVPPREVNKESPAFQKAFTSEGERSDVTATAYTKFEKGGDQVAARKGPLNTMEMYKQGKVPYVSAAMDASSGLQGKYVVYSAHPNVVFKVEDTGSAFKGKGDSAIDIAYDDRNMEDGYKTSGTIKEISEAEAVEIAGTQKLAGGPKLDMPVARAVDPAHPAMQRPRDVANISKIVVHGDVSTNVSNLIAYSKKVDRGYHYYIALDGSITEVVPPDRVAYHIQGANSDSIGIVIVGADNGKMPTPAQDRAAKQLISQLGRQYGVDSKNVAGHGERQPNRRDVREGGDVARDIRENGYI